MNRFLRYLADKNSAHRQTDRQTDRHTPMTTRPCGLRRAGNYYFQLSPEGLGLSTALQQRNRACVAMLVSSFDPSAMQCLYTITYLFFRAPAQCGFVGFVVFGCSAVAIYVRRWGLMIFGGWLIRTMDDSSYTTQCCFAHDCTTRYDDLLSTEEGERES